MDNFVKNIIIGAGPAGLQLGYFFQKDSVPYIIFEKNEMAGSFFQSFPHTKQLISINKKYTGSDDPEFNLRHDWNSLLSDDGPWFPSYSDSYYPSREELSTYLHDYSVMNKLNIQYKTNVRSVDKTGEFYSVTIDYNEQTMVYTCEKLIIATGLSPHVPKSIVNESGTDILHYGQYPKNYFMEKENLDLYKNKSVLLVGNGNSAYELANQLTPYCSSIVILGRKPAPLSISTNYVGSVRGLYLQFMDTFLLKSLNAIEIVENGKNLYIHKKNGQNKYDIKIKCNDCDELHEINSVIGYDNIILTTGWKFDTSIYTMDIKLNQHGFPIITSECESISSPNLFFIGSIAQSLDYKKSSGGFIHGFRYLIRYFYQYHYSQSFKMTYFPLLSKKAQTMEQITNHIMHRINNSSSLYQMHGQIVDIFYINIDKYNITYYQDISKHSLFSPSKNSPFLFEDLKSPIFMISLEYSKNKVTEIYDLGIKKSDVGTESASTLLHPIINVISKNRIIIETCHMDEDLLTNFNHPKKYYSRIMRLINGFIP
jgi:thioredoxin reductase